MSAQENKAGRESGSRKGGIEFDGSGLSIFIVSFNCWDHLHACLGSIFASGAVIREVVVFDNASVDGSTQRLKTTYPQVRTVESPENIGHTRAVNKGLKLVTGKRVLLLDADTEVRPDAIGTMTSFLDEHPDAWMVAPRTLNTDGTIQETARNFPTPINGLFGRQSFLTKLFPNNRFSCAYLGRGNLGRSEPFPVEFVSSACMLFDRIVPETVGTLDEGYSGYWVDADWCKRVQKAGGRIYCVPRAVIVHHEQNKVDRKRSPARIISFHTGAYRFYRLHYTFGSWDPRNLVVGFLLSARALLSLIANRFLKSDSSRQDPLSLEEQPGKSGGKIAS